MYMDPAAACKLGSYFLAIFLLKVGCDWGDWKKCQKNVVVFTFAHKDSKAMFSYENLM